METKNTYGFLALALRQRLINRWSLMHCQQRETVLEHSAVVGLLALLAGEIAQSMGEKVDVALMMGHAIVHDATEVLTGDVVTPVKKASSTLAAEFSNLESAAQQKLLNTLPVWLVNRVSEYFQPGGYEQSLVKGCDVYAAYLKCKMEVAAGNGVEFQDALDQISAVLQSIKAEMPVIAHLDAMFGDSFGLSVDKLLANGTGGDA